MRPLGNPSGLSPLGPHDAGSLIALCANTSCQIARRA